MYMPNDFSFNELNAGRVAAPRAAAVTCFATRRVAQLASVSSAPPAPILFNVKLACYVLHARPIVVGTPPDSTTRTTTLSPPAGAQR